MENIYKKIEEELDSLSTEERNKLLKKLRGEIDGIDKGLVDLLNKRTVLTILIGRIKTSLGMPTYSPEREKQIAKRISEFAKEPLRPDALLRIYERILDESRAMQREEKNKGKTFNVSINNVKSGFKNFFSKRDIFIIVVFFFVVLGSLSYIFLTPNYYEGKSPKKFEIVKGESLTDIVDSLYSNGIIPNKTNMKIVSYLFGFQREFKAGRFFIPNGLSYASLATYLISGKADYLVNVELYNGSTVKSLAAQLKYRAFIDSANFVNECNDTSFIKSLGLDVPSLQGYLLPSRYKIYQRSPVKEVIDTLYNGFQRLMNQKLRDRADSIGLSVHDVVTLASIVQGETKEKQEMPKIARVYLNRLKIGMKLQADPTIEFLQDGGWRRLSYKDLEIKSPYNTYLVYGLPPGPIGNPGKSAILATLYPANNKYLYFVANGTGGHSFSKTYSQHLRNVEKYRQWRRSQEEEQ